MFRHKNIILFVTTILLYTSPALHSYEIKVNDLYSIAIDIECDKCTYEKDYELDDYKELIKSSFIKVELIYKF